MKKIWLLVIFILQCIVFGEDVNPNDDPNWIWWPVPNVGQSYQYAKDHHKYQVFYNTTYSTVVQTKGIDTPWSQKLTTKFTDYCTRAEGWELVRRNFGSAESPVNFSAQTYYFILYNRYLSKIRIFYYPNINMSGKLYSYYSIAAYIQGNYSKEVITPLVTDSYMRLNALDSLKNNVTMITAVGTPNEDWIFADFQVNYDPLLAGKDATLFFEFNGIDVTDVEAGISGTILQQNSASSVKQGGSSSNFYSKIWQGAKKVIEFGTGVTNAINAGNEAFKSSSNNMDSLKVNLKKNATAFYNWAHNSKSQHIRDSFGPMAQSLFTTLDDFSDNNWVVKSINLAANFIPFGNGVTSAVSMISGLFGGTKNSDNPAPIPLNFDVKLSLNGKLTLAHCFETIKLYPPTSEGANNQSSGSARGSGNMGTKTVYNKPLGIFNLKSTPVIRFNEFIMDTTRQSLFVGPHPYLLDDYGNPKKIMYPYDKYYNQKNYYSFSIDNLDSLFNYSNGLKLIDVKKAIVIENLKLKRKSSDLLNEKITYNIYNSNKPELDTDNQRYFSILLKQNGLTMGNLEFNSDGSPVFKKLEIKTNQVNLSDNSYSSPILMGEINNEVKNVDEISAYYHHYETSIYIGSLHQNIYVEVTVIAGYEDKNDPTKTHLLPYTFRFKPKLIRNKTYTSSVRYDYHGKIVQNSVPVQLSLGPVTAPATYTAMNLITNNSTPWAFDASSGTISNQWLIFNVYKEGKIRLNPGFKFRPSTKIGKFKANVDLTK